MCDKDDKQEKEIRDSAESSSSGCIIWPIFLLEVPGIILWVTWLIQGQPDNWYGKLYRFQWKATAVLILFGIICAVISWCMKHFSKNTENDNEEKR